jgi:hypothetical protein
MYWHTSGNTPGVGAALSEQEARAHWVEEAGLEESRGNANWNINARAGRKGHPPVSGEPLLPHGSMRSSAGWVTGQSGRMNRSLPGVSKSSVVQASNSG